MPPVRSVDSDLVVAAPAPNAKRGRVVLELGRGHAEIFAEAAAVPMEVWEATFGGSPKDFEYYRLLEETQREHFEYRYAVFFDERSQAIALQPLILVEQDLTTSFAPSLARIVKGLRAVRARFLRTKILMAGCLVGDGKLGIMPGVSPENAASLMAEGLLRFAAQAKIRLLVVKDFPATEQRNLSALQRAGFTRLESFPSLELDLGFSSFEQYMEERLSKATRKNLRRKLRVAASASPPVTLEVLDDCSEVIDEIYPLYRNVAAKSDVTFEVFTREYFLYAARRTPGRYRYFVWRQNGKAIAFSFCTLWGDTIYDNDIGLDYSVAHDLHLYYLTFHDIVTWALGQGLKRYCSAPFNYDPKLRLRQTLVPLDLYVRHTSPFMNIFVKLFAPFFAPGKSDPVLRRYRKRSGS